jgi:hypothetical protein
MAKRDYTAAEIKSELATMTDRELVAYWNILQVGARCTMSEDDRALNVLRAEIVGDLLTGRGIPHKAGKKIKRAIAKL